MTKRAADHASFVLERTYAAAPARVFKALSEAEAKSAWFLPPAPWAAEDYEFDFREGGHERLLVGPAEGPKHRYSATYFDVVPNERVVFAYEMHLDDRRISVSLTTIELNPAPGGTHLVFTEQDVFLDGYDDAAQREAGTVALLDQLGASLEAG